MKAPTVVPEGWQHDVDALFRRYYSGLAVLVSIDTFAPGDEDTPPAGPGEYTHVSISRRDRYPGWDEMRDLVYSCGFFDRGRAVMMVLPAPENYVNIHQNCFHFWQRRVAP